MCVCVCVCVFVFVCVHVVFCSYMHNPANLIFRSEVVGVVTDEDRRNMRNRERAFVRESAEAKEVESDLQVYRVREIGQLDMVYRDSESGPQTVNIQPAVELTEMGVSKQNDIKDDSIQNAEQTGDREGIHSDKGSHGDKESSPTADSKEEEAEVVQGCEGA